MRKQHPTPTGADDIPRRSEVRFYTLSLPGCSQPGINTSIMSHENGPYEMSFLTFNPGKYPAHEMIELDPSGVVEYNEDGDEKPRYNCYRRLVFAGNETVAEQTYLSHLKDSGVAIPEEHEICIDDDVDHLYDDEENVAQRRPIGTLPEGLEW